MSWSELEAGAPDLANAARERVAARGVALLGTIRPDGSPRISPVEPFLLSDRLVFGLMPSPKLDDLHRDPRCVLHSVIVDSSGAEPEVKLTGRAVPTEDPEILAADGTWWAARADDAVSIFAFDVEEAVLVAWNPDFDRMRVVRWTGAGGRIERERTYP